MQHFSAANPAIKEAVVVWKTGGVLGTLDFGGYETRNASVQHLLSLADQDGRLPDFPPTYIHTGDQAVNRGDPSWSTLAFSTAPGFLDVPVPDFLFDGWPQVGLGDYEDCVRDARVAGADSAKANVVGWIGNCATHESRARFHALAAEHPDLFDVRDITWVPQPGEISLATTGGNAMSLAEQVRTWGALIDIEGRGWSARLKLLLHSGRPVLIQDRPWKEWFWPQLEPMVHFIPVAADLSDVVERARWTIQHPDEAAAIGAAGQQFAAEHLTRAAAITRWRDVLTDLAGAEEERSAIPQSELRTDYEAVLRVTSGAYRNAC